jgi:hypothetical protein
VSLVLGFLLSVRLINYAENINRYDFVSRERAAEEAGLKFRHVSDTLTIFQNMLLLATFGIVLANPSEAGWPSILQWVNLGVLAYITLGDEENKGLDLLRIALRFLVVFEYGATLYLLIGRSAGSVGNVAYKIINLNGCTLATSTYDPNFVGGWFRGPVLTIQWVNFVLATVTAIASTCMSWKHNLRLKYGVFFFSFISLFLSEFFVFVVKGSNYGYGVPFFLSGDCALIEPDPRDAYYNSEIEAYWKAFMTILGV